MSLQPWQSQLSFSDRLSAIMKMQVNPKIYTYTCSYTGETGQKYNYGVPVSSRNITHLSALSSAMAYRCSFPSSPTLEAQTKAQELEANAFNHASSLVRVY